MAKILKGTARFTLKKIAESLLTKEDLNTAKSDDIVEKADDMLSSSSRLVQFITRIALFIFDWGAFFFLKFERFCNLSPVTRKRYINLWMTHKIGIFRHLFQLLRILIVSAFYDNKKASKKIGFDQ